MSEPTENTWRVYRGDELVAELLVAGLDMPFMEATVQPGPAFDDMRPLFEAELRELNAMRDDAGRWEVVYRQLREQIRLCDPEGRDIPEFLLHIDGDKAWWRWHDEPFDNAPSPG